MADPNAKLTDEIGATVSALDQPAESEAQAPDPFDLSNLRLSQAFIKTMGVKKVLTTVPVKKPNPQDWVRVRPEPEFRENFAMIELKDDREEYVVAAPIIPALMGEFTNKTLYTAINRQGVLFLWPVRLPESDGRQMDWHRSAREAAGKAMTQWIRSKANRSLGAYEIFESEVPIPDPEWPSLDFQEIVKIAFRERLITSIDHPVVKRLRGLS